MFRIPSFAQVETIAGLVNDRVAIPQMTVLSTAVYRELSPVEPENIDSLMAFYQKDKQHEQLMEQISDEMSRAVTGLIAKVQNELLDLVDTTFEEVQRAVGTAPENVITHRITMVPELKFLDSDVASEVAAIDISNMVRTEVDLAKGMKFQPRTAPEILQRISKTMTEASFELFTQTLQVCGVSIVDIYDRVIRGMDHKVTPLQRMGALAIPYTYLEAILGYHIAHSLQEHHDDETHLTEVGYSNFIAAKVNNMCIRYKDAVTMIHQTLKSNMGNPAAKANGDVIEVTLYEPMIKALEDKEDKSRQDIIEAVLAKATTGLKGSIPGQDAAQRYQTYRKDVLAKQQMQLSSDMIIALQRSLENFVTSMHFEDWYTANYDGAISEAVRTSFLDDMRSRLAGAAVSCESELYTLVLDIVCEVFYKKPAIRKFINDIRVITATGDVTINEAVGIASDRLIVRYLTDMIKG